ncbi:MAG: class I SAM-dependent methyltransferase [Omnitrophica bacterium]|nr:class I SAM-dependent methyltransferase [Candidatus Omnitrophota bacterium]
MKFEHVNCNICGLDRARDIGKRKSPNRDPGLETNIARCTHCGLLYPNPMPLFTKAEMQGNFKSPEKYFSPNLETRLKFFRNVLCELEKMKPGKGRMLDVGCGRGEFLYVAREKGWKAIGTDISEAFVDYARSKFSVDALTGDLEDIDLERNSFDAASLISVIQYVQNPSGTLKKINSVLKENGILYIEVTNEDALVFKIGDFFKNLKEKRKITTRLSPLFPSFQIYGFGKESLKNALESAGFKVCRVKTGGLFGGGRLPGRGPGNAMLNFARKIVIFIGGLTGNGHLIFCIAKKGRME